MAVPVVETFQAGGTTNLSTLPGLPATKPSGVVAGDLLLIIACCDMLDATPRFSDSFSGWNFVNSVGGNPPACHIGLYWREATGSEGATETVPVDGTPLSSDEGVSFYLRISGADTTTPIHKESFNLQLTSTTSHAVTGVTTTLDDCLCIYGLSFDGGDGVFSVTGTGWSEIAENAQSTNANDSSGCCGQRDLVTAGASGTATVASTANDGSAFFQVAIAPAAGGATTPKGPLGHPFKGSFGGPI